MAYLADSVFAFSDLPLRLLVRAGGLGVLVALALGGAAIVGRLMAGLTCPAMR